ncbi:MAG TPA: PorV/PorQ family protein [bacterium]|nr:PorV/PorQ family protein [bacterium]
MKRISWILIINILICRVVYAGGAGTKTSEFLNLGVGARALGMSSAYTAADEDVYAAYWNPAGLASLKSSQAAFMHNSLPEKISQDYIIFGFPLAKKNQYLAFLLNFGRYDDEILTVYPDLNNNNPYTNKKFDGSDLLIGASYAYKNKNNIQLGLTLKYISQDIYNYNARAMAVDAGLLYKVNNTFNIGTGIYNFGTKMKFNKKSEELPVKIKVGVSTKLVENIFMINGDICYIKDEDVELALGVEVKPFKFISLRAGLNNVNDAGSAFTLGLGFNFDQLNLDYAYEPFDDLNASHKVSLDYSFKTVDHTEKTDLKEKTQKTYSKIDFDKLLKEGYSFILDGNYFSALFKFNEIVSNDRFHISGRLWLGYTHAKLGNINAAIAEYRKVLELDPSNIIAKRSLYILGY